MISLKQIAAIVGAAAVLAACGGEPDPEPNPLGPPPPEKADPGTVWSYLQAHDYQRYWRPESTANPGLHRSRAPHGPLIRAYVNRTAHQSRPLGQGELPPGSVVVLESYSTQPQIHTIDVMAKIPDHRPATNDWAFFRFGPSGSVRLTDNQVRLQAKTEERGCIHCHRRTAEETDFLFQPRLGD